MGQSYHEELNIELWRKGDDGRLTQQTRGKVGKLAGGRNYPYLTF